METPIIANLLLRGFGFGLINACFLCLFFLCLLMRPFLLCAVGLGCCETSEQSPVHNLGINKINAYVFFFLKIKSMYRVVPALIHHLAPDVELSLLLALIFSFDFIFSSRDWAKANNNGVMGKN